ncbi:hypothetical protein M434DRAFT_121032 [Hypoxylon sp. CO27-5]|nr:hypothetical protein M434DRAFT_121032 [Hypoxylon sp. CO27-5]
MYPTTPISDIRGNRSRDNSTQININNTIYPTSHNPTSHRQEKLQIQLFFSLPGNQEKDTPQGSCRLVRDFLQSLSQDLNEVMSAVRGEPLSCRCGDGCLPDLNLFKHDIKKYDKEYEDRLSVLDQLSAENFEIIEQWIKEAGPEVLVVAGEQGNGEWATNLALEIMGVKYLGPSHQAVAFTAHLCGLNLEEKQGKQVSLIQDLLGQLVDEYQDMSDDVHTCSQTESSAQEPKAVGIKVKQLWDLFTQCIKKIGIKKLIIVIDRVEYLIYANPASDETFSEFVKSLDTLRKSLWKDRIAVKIMAITGVPEVADYFKNIEALRTIVLETPPY